MNTDELIRDFTPNVHAIAAKVDSQTRRLIPRNDLIQAGFVALIESFSRYDESKNCSLATYLCLRIRGAMIDEIRRYDCTSRGIRRFQREKKQTSQQLSNELERAPTNQEMAVRMGKSLAEYRKWNNFPCVKNLPIHDSHDEDCERQLIPVTHNDPADEAEQQRTLALLRDCIKGLPEKELRVIQYDLSGLPFETISNDLKVSHSRISQIRKSAIKRLRKALGEAS
ncbi:hypothetical protein GZ77_21165 [Endozoicomonas montiporae]|uniref:RNA polymerase sigma-70 domain-containing protein n=2 Tax=Endozoicomonas montiporae TaxID=1027273 RepID=A0A081N3C1_9GAMM|nr:sigma-70 family RNA polymerase sigma factor [Endozoicomonas montiporae]AMO58241.1 flagellar biosynthesis sigma factor [Endozoicomonas montiporae CL-33]KEQ12944.1 hypothetical protein GZ77_21165 [Endozoicomonas montiporae]